MFKVHPFEGLTAVELKEELETQMIEIQNRQNPLLRSRNELAKLIEDLNAEKFEPDTIQLSKDGLPELAGRYLEIREKLTSWGAISVDHREKLEKELDTIEVSIERQQLIDTTVRALTAVESSITQLNGLRIEIQEQFRAARDLNSQSPEGNPLIGVSEVPRVQKQT